MDNHDQGNDPAASEIIFTERAIASQKLTIGRLAASNLDVSWAEMNLREMNDHLKLVQHKIDVVGPSAGVDLVK